MGDLPDWFAASVIKGIYAGELKTVAVDSQGRIIMLPYGVTTIDGAVDVTQVEKDREIQGSDGVTLRTLKVDDLGRLIAMVKALYGTTVKDVQCDTNGNLTLNLKAQDLAEIINRPKYGAAQQVSGVTACAANKWVTLFTVSGKGVTYGGIVAYVSAVGHAVSQVKIEVDGVLLDSSRIDYLWDFADFSPFRRGLYLSDYDTTNSIFVVNVSPGITFESSIVGKFYNEGNPTANVEYLMQYALI